MGGVLGVISGAYALHALMKDYPARGIGLAFVIYLAAIHLPFFVFFLDLADLEVYLQSAVAAVTAWFTFRLPPLTQSKLLKQKQVQPILNAQAKDPTKANPMDALDIQDGVPPGPSLLRPHKLKNTIRLLPGRSPACPTTPLKLVNRCTIERGRFSLRS